MSKPKYMQAYELYQQGKTVDEIAEILGVKKKVVYKYIRIARQKLGEVEKKVERVEKKEEVDLTGFERRIREVEAKVEELSRRIDASYGKLDAEVRNIDKLVSELVEEVKKIKARLNNIVAEINKLKPKVPEIKISSLADLAEHAEEVKEKREKVLKKFGEILRYIDENDLDIGWHFDIRGWGKERKICLTIVPYRQFCSDGKVYTTGGWYSRGRTIDASEITPGQWKMLVKRIEQIYKHVLWAVQTGKIPKQHAEKLEQMFRELIQVASQTQ